MTHLVAELVAKGRVQGDYAAPAGAAMYLHSVGVLAATVVGSQLGHHIGVAALPLPRRAVDAVVGIVDAVGDELLADALAHGAVVPAPFARIEVGEQGAIRQHHLGQRQGGILTHDETAGRYGLEVLPMRLGILGKGKLVARCGQHADVDGVDQQLPRCPHLEARQLAVELVMTEPQAESRYYPFGGQYPAPGIAGVGDAVIFQLTVTDPLTAHKFELLALTAGEGHLTATESDSRVVAGIGSEAHHLAFQRRIRRQINVAYPAPVCGLDGHKRMDSQLAQQEGAGRITQLCQFAAAVDDACGTGARGEIDPLFGGTLQVVSGFG